MSFKRLIRLVMLAALIACSGLITSCTNLFEDLPECRLFVRFKYDYNMLSVDAFHTQVDKVQLYVFDKEDKFLFQQTEEGSALATGSYLMQVELPVGEYQFMAWAGAHDSYEITSLQVGESTINDLKLQLRRDQSLVIDKEVEPLWYGEILDVNFTATTNQTETINLIKDTNKVRFVLQGKTDSWTLNVDDYTYQIIESNGYINYDNSLLPDDVLSFQPYYKEQRNPSAGVVEMNTLRLMADRETRFVVTEKSTGRHVLNINLTDFLLMTEMEGHKWSAQEYFDRQDEYAIVFFFGDNPGSDSWLTVQININGWTYYFQTENDSLKITQ
ncbi:MAG: FimB/Mfa2 family fimbrial subunit [Bacteroides sp.]|nr:FimB/Mfa2 family fimbrial subunit [Bacteroides sp.]